MCDVSAAQKYYNTKQVACAINPEPKIFRRSKEMVAFSSIQKGRYDTH